MAVGCNEEEDLDKLFEFREVTLIWALGNLRTIQSGPRATVRVNPRGMHLLRAFFWEVSRLLKVPRLLVTADS